MTSYSDVENLIATTDANTNKNYSTATYSFSSSSVSVADNAHLQRDYSIPLSTSTRQFNIIVNMSDENSSYYPVDRIERRENSGTGSKQWALTITASGSTATLSVFFVNSNTGASRTFAAFTLNVIRRDFVDEL